MCNAWNHSRSCNCGWGGGGYGGGYSHSHGTIHTVRYGGRSLYTMPTVDVCRENTYRWSLYYEDYTVPTSCPICGDAVFFVRHNGGSVWFDTLGYPWSKHSCFDMQPSRAPSVAVHSTQEIEHHHNINTTFRVYNHLHSHGDKFKDAVLGVIVESQSIRNESIKISINKVTNSRITWLMKDKVSVKELAGCLVLVDSVTGAVYVFLNDGIVEAERYAAEEANKQNETDFKVGDLVEHPKFGKGQVYGVERFAGDHKLSIYFNQIYEYKKVLASIANITKLN